MKAKRKVSIETIEKMAVRGKNVNSFFSTGQMMPPLTSIQRVNVDFTLMMLRELDKMAEELNISRQAVIKSLLMYAIDQHKLATKKQGA